MDISDKLRLADSLYAAYSLEETIYQLAKVSLIKDILFLIVYIQWYEWVNFHSLTFIYV